MKAQQTMRKLLIERNCVVNEVREAIDKAYAFAGKTSLNELCCHF